MVYADVIPSFLYENWSYLACKIPVYSWDLGLNCVCVMCHVCMTVRVYKYNNVLFPFLCNTLKRLETYSVVTLYHSGIITVLKIVRKHGCK
jgi:hypothetical protein